MKVRLMGTAQECAAAVELMRLAMNVVEVSDAYPNRGNSSQVRMYVEARIRIESKGAIQ